MDKLLSEQMSRRVFLASAALLIPSFAIQPRLAFADEAGGDEYAELFLYRTETGIFNFSSLPQADKDRLLLLQAEYESSRLIAELEMADGMSLGMARTRPKYSTVYSKAVKKNSGFRDLPNQRKNGYSFEKDSQVIISLVGGPNITLSFGFPSPWGTTSLGVSFATARSSSAIVAYGITIPGDKKRHKIQLNLQYESIPYTVYYTNSSGKKSVYKRAVTTPSLVGEDYRTPLVE